MICYYNFDILAGNKKEITSQQIENNKYFAMSCLDIIGILLENIQKSQLVENEDTYFDLLSNFMYKSHFNDIYGLMGLDKK